MNNADRQSIAIIGLGRVGSTFLSAVLRRRDRVNLSCVAETGATPARAQAAAAGIRIATLDDIVGLGDAIDVIFDLTGSPGVRRELRSKLQASENEHTVIASETIARLIWSLVSEDEMPQIAGRKTGY